MSNGFYKYIADNTISYFYSISDSIRKGERYSLILDNEELASGVYEALKEKTAIDNMQGKYSYKNKYETFTIKMSEEQQIVIAAKSSSVTDSFLAKLRNTKLTDNCYPIMIITYDTIDTIISGTANMAAAGMPFNPDTIMENLNQRIKTGQLSKADQVILQSELELKKQDRYNDKSSLYAYKDILIALGKGTIDECDYAKFSLFPDGLIKTLVDEKKIKERLSENRETFEQVARVFRRGNIKEKLEKEFDKEFVNTLVDRKKKNLPWYEGYKYDAVKASRDKIKKKTDNPLEISNSNIEIYAGSPVEYSYTIDEKAFIKSDGATKSAERKKSILIYNFDNKEEISIGIATNISIKRSDIFCENAEVESSSKEIVIKIKPTDGCYFSKTTICDKINNIKYEIKVCVLNTPKTYLDSIKTSYVLYVSEKRHKSKIQLVGVVDEIVINADLDKEASEQVIEEGQEYLCSYDEKLNLQIDRENVNPDTGKLSFSLKCGGTQIPFELHDDPVKPVVLTGIAAFKKKFNEKRSLEYRSDSGKEKIICGTEEFFPKENREYLNLEKEMIANKWMFVKHSVNGFFGQELNVSDEIKNSYYALCDCFEKLKTVPSLAYYKDELLELAKQYVEIVENYIIHVEGHKTLSSEDNDFLLLGCVEEDIDGKLIKMSPLHPLNILYQLNLLEEHQVGEVREVLVEKLTPLYLIPYLFNESKQLFHSVEQKDAPEWRIYAPFSDKRYQGTRSFVQKLVGEKITGYKEYFSFLFDDIGNRKMLINLVNMGDCREVFRGVIAYYIKEIRAKGIEDTSKFEFNIYSEENISNCFEILADYKKLKQYILSEFIREKDDIDVNDVAQTMINNIQIYYRKLSEEKFQYAHTTFYEMTVSEDCGQGQVDSINTGISLEGLVSGMPSVLNSDWYKTGFGMKYAPKNRITKMAQLYNAMYRVANSGSAYEPDVCLFTEIEKNQEGIRDKIYKSSNWVVFVDPKVDLTFFQRGKTDNNELMIIHYSDQYTSSNGYDDITVTQKSEQYNEIICEQLQKKGVTATHEDVNNIISLFNAINGNWMLRLITAKRLIGAADSNFSREKMSILSAIKLSMGYYKHPNIIWIPISLEEMLRVSGGAGYSQKEGLLSARNLGFATQATSDDILLVGIEEKDNNINIYLHPVEVKIGQNSQAVIDKAKEQVINTHKGLWNALWPEENKDSLEAKLSRNFFMQLVIVCAEKMNLYNVYPEVEWIKVIDEWRERLLNEKYELSKNLDDLIGKGTVISFKTEVLNEYGDLKDDVCFLEYPEKKGSSFMVMTTEEIEKQVEAAKESLPERLAQVYEQTKTFDSGCSEVNDNSDVNELQDNEVLKDEETHVVKEDDGIKNENTKVGIEVIFGKDLGTGNDLIWRPTDTEQVFHTNTGIIGTMGTGKTQFTKSMITQLYKNQSNNIDGKPLGILIFDYKGDYNETKPDFVNATQAKILKPYHLPFNPLSLTKSSVNKPLLPLHTANAFKDTISKVYGLGAKQDDALLESILSAYTRSGIDPYDSSTWNKVEPTFDLVYQIYTSNEDIKKGDSLTAAMNKLQRFQIFEADSKKTKSLFEILEGVVVIDLSGYDEDIQNLIVAITLDLFYSQMQASGSSKLEGQYRQLTKMILVDEADNFMSKGFDALKKILKEGREFGVGTILSTQFLKHFGTDDDDYSKYILTWIVHNVADLKNSDVDFVFKTEAKSAQSVRLFNDIKGLKKHNSIVKIGNNNPVYVRDKAFWELMQE